MSDGSDALVYLSLGANVGDREAALLDAVRRIRTLSQTQIERVSSVYETAPWGFLEQEPYLNCVLSSRTRIGATAFFQMLKNIEKEMGREPAERNHPRLIDIDILFFGDEIIDTPDLAIPHVSIPDRRFVLEPFCEIAPDFVHPVLRKTMRELLSTCQDKGDIRRLDYTLEAPDV
jgi:2-amino-4-hydroxy-6-hydroxymethyldihydropteridine diphosphokinase